MTRRPRRLRPEEAELWRRIADTATPLSGIHPPETRPGRLRLPESVAAKGPAAQQPAKPKHRSFRIGEARAEKAWRDLAPERSDELAATPVSMDRKAFERMARGKLAPEARIDLHGMTLAEARPALTGFVLSGHARGLRLVLVITGKGRETDDDGPIPRRRGALRHEVPLWLRSAPMKPLVLEIREAHRRHGGAGALYVYLRRMR